MHYSCFLLNPGTFPSRQKGLALLIYRLPALQFYRQPYQIMGVPGGWFDAGSLGSFNAVCSHPVRFPYSSQAGSFNAHPDSAGRFHKKILLLIGRFNQKEGAYYSNGPHSGSHIPVTYCCWAGPPCPQRDNRANFFLGIEWTGFCGFSIVVRLA